MTHCPNLRTLEEVEVQVVIAKFGDEEKSRGEEELSRDAKDHQLA